MSPKLIGNTVADHHRARRHFVYTLGYGIFVCRCGHAWQHDWPQRLSGQPCGPDDGKS